MNNDKINDLLNRIEELERIIITDSLTGAYSRNYFFNYLSMTEYIGGKIYFIDLNDFKKINDEKGHVCGDELLRNFAKELENCLGAYGRLIRYGGDEFVIISKTPLNFSKIKKKFNFSVGSTRITSEASDKLLQRADRAMYHKKKSKKATID